MMTPDEWNALKEKTLQPKAVKAPPFLWTRIQAQIAAEEARRSSWWSQSRWMTGIIMSTGVVVATLFLMLKPSNEIPLEALLQGQPHPHMAIQVAGTQWVNTDHTASFVLEDQPWVED